MVAAQQRGDEQAITRLAPVAPAARRITAESRSLRRQHATGLHVVPSLTLRQRKPGTYDAQYYLLGKTPSGQINVQEAVIVRVHGQQALIVGSQPGVVNDQSGEG